MLGSFSKYLLVFFVLALLCPLCANALVIDWKGSGLCLKIS